MDTADAMEIYVLIRGLAIFVHGYGSVSLPIERQANRAGFPQTLENRENGNAKIHIWENTGISQFGGKNTGNFVGGIKKNIFIKE